MKIANMLWRIGEELDFDRQLTWTRDAGFDGVGFHASAGVPGRWRGVEPASCSAGERRRLRRTIREFAFAEIHAPFSIELRSETLSSGTAALAPILDFAQDLGVGVVTVHARLPGPAGDPDLAGWLAPMQALNAKAARGETQVGLEIVSGFDAALGWGLPNVGVTLDVGHLYLPGNRQTLGEMGGIGEIIRHLGGALRHLHLHDVAGDTDHIEIGAGAVDFVEIAAALQAIGCRRHATLELNPDRVSPEGMRRSLDSMRLLLRMVTSG
jgi:sugar phosphate isomerase/epimerase